MNFQELNTCIDVFMAEAKRLKEWRQKGTKIHPGPQENLSVGTY